MSYIRPALAAVLVTLTAAFILTGCKSAGTGAISLADYRSEAVLVLDINQDSAWAAARAWRNDTLLTGAGINVADRALGYYTSLRGLDSTYQTVLSPLSTLSSGAQYFGLSVGSRFSDSALFAVVDTFSITDNLNPANHQLQGAGQVSLEWTAAANAERYVLAAVKVDSAYTGYGYSAYAATVGTAGTIPPEAFLNPISSEPDTGLYNIYVYALNGSPDSALAAALLPVPLPGQLLDNIDRNDWTGRVGAVTISGLDTIRVVLAAR